MSRVLIVVEDRHAERELRYRLRQLDASTCTVLTSDALLAMALRRETIDARVVSDGFAGPVVAELDRIALRALDAVIGIGTTPPYADLLAPDLGPSLAYSLIPTFIRSVRNVAAVRRAIAALPANRVVIIGGGRLAKAARLVAAETKIAVEISGASPWRVIMQSIARLHAGRHTRWVGSDFRTLVLEPGFLLLLIVKGLWRRISRPQPTPSRDALIVTGDRWTADIVARNDDQARSVVLAGATQPGRALFPDERRVLPIELWTEPADLARGVVAFVSMASRTLSRVRFQESSSAFVVDGISCWPLVADAFRLTLMAWMPLLRFVRVLAKRVARSCGDAALLTSADVTGYATALIAGAREARIPSTSIQHGLMGEPNGHDLVRADTLAAWGPATEAWYRAHGSQHARFVVTGNPRFDTFPAPHDRPPRDPSMPFTIVICTGFVSEFSVCASDVLNLGLIQATLDWSEKRTGVRIIHKLHPGEELGHYIAAARTLGWRRDILTMTDEPVLHDLLQSSDLLVTGYSTTVIESILLGTPVIVADFERRQILPVDRIAGVTIASSIAELNQRLDSALASPTVTAHPTNAELQAYISNLDRRAGERVAALVSSKDR